ncbi:MAG: PadR family transcriptional regulator [Sphingomonas sanxanigenens]|uniref:PadR family transcriptional regulator n=1 Tax=Sphingomonas sanxanigenens TaxID=397260 RepID=A0A2W5ADZ9_9SPHN|nr:MAG: PadR family transcriptional regulator [Sphingomonas sanxanigenens]
MRFGMGYGAWTGGPHFGRKHERMREAMERHGRRRMFEGGELRHVLLKLIGEQPRHGYDLIREIEQLTSGAYAPSPGVIYPTLTLLQDMGLIDEEKSEGARKLFAITAEGRTHLAEHEAEIAALFERLAALGAWRERTDGGPVRRAMGNLKTVLQQRLGAAGADADTQHEIAALIDELAQKIERLK